MIRIFLVALLASLAFPAFGETLEKSYKYFWVGGTTLEELEAELARRGPRLKSSGERHPGATRMQFNTRLGYAEKGGRCRVSEATVKVSAEVILPRWRHRRKADRETRLVWDALSIDIKRHENQHVRIARDHARQLERRLLRLGRHKTCDLAARKAKQTIDALLEKHDRAQTKFDAVESRSFERRLLRLMRQRSSLIKDGHVNG